MMAECLETKKSNCKNCYKCIRNCPIKSIKFYDGQAHIIRDECVLCGECYVVCPQDAKKIRNDIEKVKTFLNDSHEVYVSLAPSYAAWYEGYGLKDIESALLKLGIKGVQETAIGAAIVKKEYENMLKKNNNGVVISSCCHTVNTLIERHYKNALPYLASVISPMQAHAKQLKEDHPGCRVVFVGPCISKKAEAEKYNGVVDAVLTFEELDDWFADEKIEPVHEKGAGEKHRTNVFPTTGGIIRSMYLKDDVNYVAIDGMESCMSTLEDIDSGKIKNCFIEMSACKGSCVGGPIMKKRRRNPVVDFMAVDKRFGENDYAVKEKEAGEIKREFRFEGTQKLMPNSSAIDEILRKMGKNSREQELNCGSCGYNTCREKAIAVLQGKADLSMCMPYLKEKAESFSDKIISNTPNGIIVLDEELNVQMINTAARKILNLSSASDILNNPVVRILDPFDYVMALSEGKNVYDNSKYLAEYQKYIEETIIYDKEYHIILIIMKDVSREEEIRISKEEKSKAAVEITDKVVEKQMRVVQEIASLLGETTAETKIALTKLKETLSNE